MTAELDAVNRVLKQSESASSSRTAYSHRQHTTTTTRKEYSVYDNYDHGNNAIAADDGVVSVGDDIESLTPNEQQQLNALRIFYESTGGSKWLRKCRPLAYTDNCWDRANNTQYCDWYGITCGSFPIESQDIRLRYARENESLVIALNLTNNLLSGGIQPSFSALARSLRSLDLSHNLHFLYIVVSSVSQLTELQDLRLGFTALSQYVIPITVSSLFSLTHT